VFSRLNADEQMVFTHEKILQALGNRDPTEAHGWPTTLWIFAEATSWRISISTRLSDASKLAVGSRPVPPHLRV